VNALMAPRSVQGTQARCAALKAPAQCTIFASGHHVRWLIVKRGRF
jgi:hypothetical protein